LFFCFWLDAPVVLLYQTSIFQQISIVAEYPEIDKKEIVRKWFAWDATFWNPSGGYEAKSDHVSQVELALVYSKALNLEDHVAFLRRRSEHTTLL
jgi:hypothetical protein